MKSMAAKILKKNNYANIWIWQEFPFKDNMLKTMSDLTTALINISGDKNSYNFIAFEKK